MHGYWQAVMTSFEQELMGSHGFSLTPPDGLSMGEESESDEHFCAG